MFTNHRQLILIIGIALVLILGIYSIAQSRGLPSITTQALASLQQADIPSGAVMFFDLETCPAGWSELTAAQGRYVVGLPGGGTRGATVGTALSAQENRPVGQHAHTVDDPGHNHALTDPGHSHAATDQGHAHPIDDPGHKHQLSGHILDEEEYWGDKNGTPNFAGYLSSPWTTRNDTGITILTGQADITVDSNTTGISVLNHTTGVTVEEAGVVTGTNAPYVQLLVCQKD